MFVVGGCSSVHSAMEENIYTIKLCLCLFACSLTSPQILHVHYSAGICVAVLGGHGGWFIHLQIFTILWGVNPCRKGSLKLCTIVRNDMHVFYDCSKLRNLC